MGADQVHEQEERRRLRGGFKDAVDFLDRSDVVNRFRGRIVVTEDLLVLREALCEVTLDREL